RCRDLCKRQRHRRAAQAVEMFGEAKNAPVVESQAFPHRIAALHDRIERADPRFATRKQLAVDVNQQVSIALVEGLQHELMKSAENSACRTAPDTPARRRSIVRGVWPLPVVVARNPSFRQSCCTRTAPTRRRSIAGPAPSGASPRRTLLPVGCTGRTT